MRPRPGEFCRDVEDAVPYEETRAEGGLTLGGISSILKNTKKAAEQAEERAWKRASGKS